MRSGQEKQREGVIPNTSQAHCSNTAAYLFTPSYTSRKYTERCVAQIVAGVRYAIKHLYIFITNMKHRGLLGCIHLPVEPVCPGRLASRLALSAYRLGDLL